ncbi:hypothetical protein DCS_05177 [Drechmeria coniospora]|uniref:Uncharacterized protein n=1 Tax=Drechmeria coniospora TaxID=98403 RepID=A0A151GM22_DRECN|nr:hypothetical protein DCS_05177 [Drechmeria coniospora]KYK58164.1 hypothetical protein DCS_05177 [Drechmeria coniospora]ODA83000.1 hypothetical protein RJ55_01509 [Drechmeria coniospora]
MDDEYADFDDEDPLPCYFMPKKSESATAGTLRTYRPGNSETGLIYDTERHADYHVTVERLLGMDGWESPNSKSPMTLLILKLAVNCRSKSNKATRVTAKLEFESRPSGEKADPEIETWAPFKEPERSNATLVGVKKSDRIEVGAGVKAEFAELSGAWGSTEELSFEHTAFDMRTAFPLMNEDSGKRNGIEWCFSQNKLLGNDPPPVIHLAVLLRRASVTAAYVVKFEIDVVAGTMFNLKNNILKVFGCGPGITKPFLVQPDVDAPKVRYEGHHILKLTESYKNNMGELGTKDVLHRLVFPKLPASAQEAGAVLVEESQLHLAGMKGSGDQGL